MPSVLQDRCSKCNLPLETASRQLVGLGDQCKENVHLAYLQDLKYLQDQELSRDTMFEFLSLFGSLVENKFGIHEALLPVLDRLSLALISHTKGTVLPFNIVLDAFSVARNSDPYITERIHKALSDLGFKRFINLATGQVEYGKAILSFNEDTQQITLNATVRRCASEVFNKLEHRRPDTNFWIFPSLYDAQVIYETVQLRWPLPEQMIITPEFMNALERSKMLPPKPPKPRLFESEVVQQRIFKIKTKDANGNYLYDYKKQIQPIYPFMTSPVIGGSYLKGLSVDGLMVYSVDESKYEVVSAFIEETLTLEIKTSKRKVK